MFSVTLDSSFISPPYSRFSGACSTVQEEHCDLACEIEGEAKMANISWLLTAFRVPWPASFSFIAVCPCILVLLVLLHIVYRVSNFGVLGFFACSVLQTADQKGISVEQSFTIGCVRGESSVFSFADRNVQ